MSSIYSHFLKKSTRSELIIAPLHFGHRPIWCRGFSKRARGRTPKTLGRAVGSTLMRFPMPAQLSVILLDGARS
jgi:hypothetical protein